MIPLFNDSKPKKTFSVAITRSYHRCTKKKGWGVGFALRPRNRCCIQLRCRPTARYARPKPRLDINHVVITSFRGFSEDPFLEIWNGMSSRFLFSSSRHVSAFVNSVQRTSIIHIGRVLKAPSYIGVAHLSPNNNDSEDIYHLKLSNPVLVISRSCHLIWKALLQRAITGMDY